MDVAMAILTTCYGATAMMQLSSKKERKSCLPNHGLHIFLRNVGVVCCGETKTAAPSRWFTMELPCGLFGFSPFLAISVVHNVEKKISPGQRLVYGAGAVR